MFGPDTVVAANKALLKTSGNKEGSKMLDVIQDNDECQKIIDTIKKPAVPKMTPEQALELIINARLTKSDYKK